MRRVWVRRALLVSCIVVLLAGAWSAWQVWQVNRDLNSAVSAVDRLRSAAEAGDTEAMQSSIGELTESSASADDRTSGLAWSALGKVPVLGDDVRGVRVVSSVVHDLAVNGAQPLVAVSQDLNGLLPRGGQVSIEALTALQEPVADAAEALAVAGDALGEEDPSSYVMRLREKYRDLEATVRDTRHALSAAATALEVMPTMLGSEGPRTYLLVFQNNSEIRATGGLPGAVAQLAVNDGRIQIQRQRGGGDLDRAGNPILPLSAAEQTLWDDRLGTYFVNANLTPDFPRAAGLMQAWWEDKFPVQVDGVLSLDPVALSYVLAVTGPIKVGELDLTADNVVDELLHGVYLRYEDRDEQDAVFQEVARTAFDTILGGADDAPGLLRALARGADESRILVHSFEPGEQQILGRTAVAGALDPVQEGPQVTVAFNDSTGGKMSYFLRPAVRVEATSCVDGVQSYTGNALLESVAPADAASLPIAVTAGGTLGAPPGTQFVNVLLFGPAGGSVTDLRVNAQRVESAVVDYGGRPVDTVAVQLEPGQKVRVSWRMMSGPDQTGLTRVAVTPGIETKDYSSEVASACRS